MPPVCESPDDLGACKAAICETGVDVKYGIEFVDEKVKPPARAALERAASVPIIGYEMLGTTCSASGIDVLRREENLESTPWIYGHGSLYSQHGNHEVLATVVLMPSLIIGTPNGT